MPFRQAKPVRKLIESHKRTGEPFPVKLLDLLDESAKKGHGKALGSYTESMREALWKWMELNIGSSIGPIMFEYRLSRKKVVTVIGTFPYIKHNPIYGRGKRGFALLLHTDSIDGVQYRGWDIRHTAYAWDRIIGKEKIYALPANLKEIENGYFMH